MIDTSRPGYGGTCYSDFGVSQTYPVIAYNEAGDTASQIFSASVSGAQAYAHPIDGFALSSPTTVGCPTRISSLPSDTSTSSTSTISPSPSNGSAPSSTPSTAAIAGASVGSIVALAAIVGFIWYILGYYRRNRKPPPPPPKIQHQRDGLPRHEKEGDFTCVEIGTSARLQEKEKFRHSELNDGHGAFEMSAVPVYEMDATEEKKRLSRMMMNWKTSR